MVLMKQKGFATILVLVGILIIGALTYGISYLVKTKSQINQTLTNKDASETTQNPSQNSQTNVDSAKVFYIDSSLKTINMLDGINTTPQSVVNLPPREEGTLWDANLIGLSPDKKWLLYYTNTKDASTLEAYDVTNKTGKIINKINQSAPKLNDARYEILWSPNGKYVIFSRYNYFGNSSSDSISEVYSYPNFEKITSFYSYNSGYSAGDSSSFPLSIHLPRILFLDDENVSYLDPINKKDLFDLDGISYKIQSQISLFNTKTKKTTTLVNYDEGLMLGLIKAKDAVLYYFTSDQQGSSNPTYKFYRVDKNANTAEVDLGLIKQVSPDTIPDSIKTFQTTKKNLPSPYSSDDYYIRRGPLGYNKTHWVILELVQNNYKTPKQTIAILNQDNPQNTFKIIGQGSDPIW